MTNQLLAQAVAVAYNPKSTRDQLVEVIGDLLIFGAFEAATEVARQLRAKGGSPAEIVKFERLIEWLRHVGVQFEEIFLLRANAVADDPDAADDQLLRAAECLVVWGSLEEADRALERLRDRGAYPGPVARITAASRQLRRSGILNELQSLTPQKSLNKPYEVLIKKKPGARRTIIVFTGLVFHFWVSLNVLHVFLRRMNANVIYLSDHTACLYLNGLNSVGPGYESLLKMLREQLTSLGATDLYVLATSVGGFVGLRAAMDLQAQGFAGTSIWSKVEGTQDGRGSIAISRAIENCRYPEMLVNLRELLEKSEYPRRILLYCGEHNETDKAQAENLRGIPRVEINYLEGYRPHDAISGLIGRGQFERMLHRLVMGDSAEAARSDPAEAARSTVHE
jgi:hypothetical protein